jgi:hypothetical protein
MTCECSHALRFVVLSTLTRGSGIPDARVTVTAVPFLLVRLSRPNTARILPLRLGSFHDEVARLIMSSRPSTVFVNEMNVVQVYPSSEAGLATFASEAPPLCFCATKRQNCGSKFYIIYTSELYIYENYHTTVTASVARFRLPALPKKKVVGLERGPLSLVSTTEELLDRKVAAPV